MDQLGRKILFQKINILIDSLEEAENDTIGFFNDVIDVIENCKSDKELKKVLDDHLIHTGKITDYGNFGITGSYGLSIPFYPIPTNVSRTIPLDKLKQDSK